MKVKVVVLLPHREYMHTHIHIHTHAHAHTHTRSVAHLEGLKVSHPLHGGLVGHDIDLIEAEDKGELQLVQDAAGV